MRAMAMVSPALSVLSKSTDKLNMASYHCFTKQSNNAPIRAQEPKSGQTALVNSGRAARELN